MTKDRLILILRAVLTAAFLYFGLRKLLGGVADVAIYDAIGFGQWPRYVTGSVEIACAIGLWLPGRQAFAALGLVTTMIVGTMALIFFAGLPFWHLIVLGVAAALVAGAFRHQIMRFTPKP